MNIFETYKMYEIVMYVRRKRRKRLSMFAD